MMAALASFVCGLIFGLGLVISGMTQPQKVLGFLDIFGRWDPTLAFVMVAAFAVSGTGFALARKRRRPLRLLSTLGPRATISISCSSLDLSCLGIGWGFVRLCPARRWLTSRACGQA